jgi:hypothetical protein
MFFSYSTRIKLIQDVSTRWNSTYDMLDSICTNRDALKEMFTHPENRALNNHALNENEFKFINEFCNLLHPLCEFTELLSGSNYITSSILYPVLFNLIYHQLTSMHLVNAQLIVLNLELRRSLIGRFTYILTDPMFLGATFLDYRFRKYEFIKDVDTRELKLKQAKQLDQLLQQLY